MTFTTSTNVSHVTPSTSFQALQACRAVKLVSHVRLQSHSSPTGRRAGALARKCGRAFLIHRRGVCHTDFPTTGPLHITPFTFTRRPHHCAASQLPALALSFSQHYAPSAKTAHRQPPTSIKPPPFAMCRFWKKMHTCSHISTRPYIEVCHPCMLSNTVCPTIVDDGDTRPSHFPCWQCIKTEARSEIEARVRLENEAIAKAQEAQELANKAKIAAEQRAKEERIRREAREKAMREREEEMRNKKEKEEEEKKAKAEGGLWIETGSGRRGKGRKTANNSPSTPGFGSAFSRNGPGMSDKKENNPNTDRSVDMGGRAGHWGPKSILKKDKGNFDASFNGSGNGTGGDTNIPK
ncbi:hypothetical protein IQ07DRAFT_271455 [Pyrenochaeta sp. DS3sAY3a]|nr:hypothetical protein IQ07DRAFT_271455 [Pyrenochaeta sp. DS3sAY3a]